jgi:sugar O-acyltransferase (sialic acid O-acetyltransferase NeuD family)
MDATNGSAIRDSNSAGQRSAVKSGSALRSLPPDCQRILIVGAGGFGREMLQWARDAWPDQADRLAGFLSNDPGKLEGFGCTLPILASPDAFAPTTGDYMVLAIGIPGVRRMVAEDLLARGGRFLTLIHPTAVIADSAVIEAGAVICPYVIVSDAARVGRGTLLNYHASMAHDSVSGDFAVLSPYATLGGGAHAQEESFLGLHATLGPGTSLGARAKIAAQSVLLHDAPAESLAFGVPAKIMTGMR